MTCKTKSDVGVTCQIEPTPRRMTKAKKRSKDVRLLFILLHRNGGVRVRSYLISNVLTIPYIKPTFSKNAVLERTDAVRSFPINLLHRVFIIADHFIFILYCFFIQWTLLL